MQYKIRYIEYEGKIDEMVFDFDNQYQPLTTFLFSEVSRFEDWIKSDFDEVISRKSLYKEINGNICCVEIRPDTTIVFDNLAEDDEEYYNTCCEVDTKELRQLIDEWCDKVREFKKKYPK